MALQWFIASAILKETNGSRVQADVKYYDDQDPLNSPTPTKFLHAQTFFFDPAMAEADMGKMLESEGARARTAYLRAAALAAQFPVGTHGVVP